MVFGPIISLFPAVAFGQSGCYITSVAIIWVGLHVILVKNGCTEVLIRDKCLECP